MVWGAQTYVIGTAAARASLSGTTESKSDIINLDALGWDGIEIEVDFEVSGANDDIKVNLYGALVAETDQDTARTAINSFTISNAASTRFMATLQGVPKAKIGVVQLNGSDTHKVAVSYRGFR